MNFTSLFSTVRAHTLTLSQKAVFALAQSMHVQHCLAGTINISGWHKVELCNVNIGYVMTTYIITHAGWYHCQDYVTVRCLCVSRRGCLRPLLSWNFVKWPLNFIENELHLPFLNGACAHTYPFSKSCFRPRTINACTTLFSRNHKHLRVTQSWAL